jgi:periplasmic protein TonB
MFDQTFVEGRGKTRSVGAVILSLVVQLVAVAILIIIPLIYTDTLPRATLASMLTAPPPPPPPPPPPAPTPKIVHVAPRQFDAGRLMAPKVIPKDIAMIKEEDLPPPSAGVVGGVSGGVPGGSMGGVLGGIVGAVPLAAPPPPKVDKPKPPSRIRVGGNVQAANLIRKVVPVYPTLAKQARISGTVRFQAIIGKDGTIQNLQLVSGHPLLVAAAQQAVSQWVYKPTLLNGDPVEVVTTIDVNFTLSQ